MKKVFMIVCLIFMPSIGYVAAEEDNQMRKQGVLLGQVDYQLARLGYDHLAVGLGYNGTVEQADYQNALRNLNDALSTLSILHIEYTDLDNIIIVPSFPIQFYGTTGDRIQLVTAPYPIGKTVYIPHHLDAETIREEFSIKTLPELSDEDLVGEAVIYPHQ